MSNNVGGEAVHELVPLLHNAVMVAPGTALLSERLPQIWGGEATDAGTQPCLKEHVDQAVTENCAEAGVVWVDGRNKKDVGDLQEVPEKSSPGFTRQLHIRSLYNVVCYLEYPPAQEHLGLLEDNFSDLGTWNEDMAKLLKDGFHIVIRFFDDR